MSSLEIGIEESGAARIVADLTAMGLRAEDVMPVWPALDAVFHEDESRRFDEEGPGWAPLADSTVATKAGLGQPSKILQATGELKRSLTTAAVGADRSTGNRLVFGTDVSYAHFHQSGTVKMPRRQVVGVSDSARAAMVAILNEFVGHGLP